MSRNGEAKLPDTPWHVGYTKKAEDDPRRHKSRCIHIYWDNSCAYNSKCIGSSHCQFYAETEEQDKKNRRDRMTNEELAMYRAAQYKDQMRKKAEELLKTNPNAFETRSIGARDCFICGEQLKITAGDRSHPSEKVCPYCGAKYSKRSGNLDLCFLVK